MHRILYKFDYKSRMKIPRTRDNNCGLTIHLSLLCQDYFIKNKIYFLSKISILKFETHANAKFIIFIAL